MEKERGMWMDMRVRGEVKVIKFYLEEKRIGGV